jgi:hypothetical protein
MKLSTESSSELEDFIKDLAGKAFGESKDNMKVNITTDGCSCCGWRFEAEIDIPEPSER